MHGKMINLKDATTDGTNYNLPFDLNDTSPPPETAYDRRIMNVWAILGLVIFGIFFLLFACVFGVLCLRGKTRTSMYRGSRSAVPPSVALPSKVRKPTFLSMTADRTQSIGRSITGMFRKKQQRPVLTEDDFAEPKDTYANLNEHFDEKRRSDELLAPSPPPTPAPAYGWSNQSAPTSARFAPPPGNPPNRSSSETVRPSHVDTSYRSQGSTTNLLRAESDSLVERSSAEITNKRNNRISMAWDHTQTRPDFDPFEEEPSRGRYDPDSRSGL